MALCSDGNKAPLERGQDGSRARRDEALHEQHEKPYGRSPFCLRPPVPVAHVIGNGLVQRTFDGPATVGNSGENRRSGSEKRPPLIIGGVSLLSTHDKRPDAGSIDRPAMEESCRRAGRAGARKRQIYRSAVWRTARAAAASPRRAAGPAGAERRPRSIRRRDGPRL